MHNTSLYSTKKLHTTAANEMIDTAIITRRQRSSTQQVDVVGIQEREEKETLHEDYEEDFQEDFIIPLNDLVDIEIDEKDLHQVASRSQKSCRIQNVIDQYKRELLLDSGCSLVHNLMEEASFGDNDNYSDIEVEEGDDDCADSGKLCEGLSIDVDPN